MLWQWINVKLFPEFCVFESLIRLWPNDINITGSLKAGMTVPAGGGGEGLL